MRLCLAFLLAVACGPARAQTLTLADVRAAAEARDPRAVQPALLARATALRLDNLRAQGRPQLALTGQATVQSDAPSIDRGNGQTVSAPRGQARVQAEAEWAVLDGGRRGLQADVERARLAEQTAGLAVTLFALRDAATDAFFAALLADARADALALAVQDLDARLAFARARVQNGAALQADADALEAERIGVQQQIDEARAGRRAAVAVLRDLTDLDVADDVALALPDLDALPERLAVDRSGRPETARADRTRDRADAEARVALAATRPTVSLFGQAGVGRPSPFDFLSDRVAPYGLAGVRLRWAPLDYGQARRTAEAARIQGDVARTEADAATRALVRQAETDSADAARLAAAADGDARVVALRASIVAVAQAQLDEGVGTVPDYVDRLTDLAAARLAAARHRIERARATARVLSALGRFPDPSVPTAPFR